MSVRWYSEYKLRLRLHDSPAPARPYAAGGWFLVGLVFSALAGAGAYSLHRGRVLDAYGQPAVGHVMKLDPVLGKNGGGALVTYRFWVDGDPRRYSHTGTFTGWETPARVSELMVSGAMARKTIPVQYLPGDPWINRPADPDRESGGYVAALTVIIPALTAALGWVMCAAGVVKWARGRGEAPCDSQPE